MAEEITVGAKVVTTDGKSLGHVKQVEPSAFLIDAPKQFDYWLENGLVKECTAETLQLTIAESELGGYKMDRPYDHNEFRASTPEKLQPSTVRDAFLR